MRGVSGLLALKLLDHSMDNLQIILLEGPDSLINFALAKKFDEHLSLSRPGRRVRKELDYQWIITSQSVVQLPEHLPKNRSLGFLEYYVPKAAIVFEVFFGAVAAASLLCEPVGKIKLGW